MLETEDILSVVPEGRESAETTMNQEEAAVIYTQYYTLGRLNTVRK